MQERSGQRFRTRPSIPDAAGGSAKARLIEVVAFAALIVGVTLVFALSIWPFIGAILWSVVAAIVFWPLNRRLRARFPDHDGLAAGATLLVMAAAVIVPALVLAGFIVQEAASVYARLQSNQIDIAGWFRDLNAALPDWLTNWLSRLGLGSLDDIRDRLGSSLSLGIRTMAAQVINLGQGVLGFFVGLGVMLYLTFFLLRDGKRMAGRIGEAVPLLPEERHILARRFISVVRATVKGSVAVAVVQGAIGGMTLWLLGMSEALLWAVVMAFCALLPAIGSGLVWAPIAIYLLATGAVWQGTVLILVGVFLIGLVDNVLRPVMVGSETKMPDFVVLISTLGGLQAFGFDGLLIGPLAAALFISAWNMLTHWRRGEAPEDEAPDEPLDLGESATTARRS